MRKVSILGLAGLMLAGAMGCETHRPYCSRCMLARNGYTQSDTAYRPRTTVTMRADEVPENPTSVQACPAVQVVSPTGTSVIQTAGPANTSAPMVTVTIPAIKIVIPMTATAGNPSSPGSETQIATQLPPAAGSVLHADVKTASPTQPSSLPIPDVNVQSAIHVQKEETAGASPAKMEVHPEPDLPPEPKPMSKASQISSDPARLPRLSLLPPDPPPEVPAHRTTAASSSRNSFMDLPPPPPPIPRSAPSSGPTLVPTDPDAKE